jgi:hypothetical protein
MTTKYVKVMVSARRGDRPPYTYTAHPRVRAGKAEDVMNREAWAIAEHEDRDRAQHVSIVPAFASVTVRVGSCSFTVYTLPIELEA